ncbi:hypothetical protein GCM10023194_33300 [Planotetraspora phitsanulokensis]|uniref:DUF4386 domain-containing protein n=1 Tax=Planotetraspora phitsanulokensis TaxID=575192 RepID=A0A8J3U242_9ACTN|nr:hypothetical protein [Planotetraspora phitsanulokensis]GII36542.1 hypothetical protein Pph01_15450 [Planotetraspora phitsanulokensis]
MVSSRWRVAAGIACLLVGSIGQLAQYLVTPVLGGDAGAADQVREVAAHLPEMRLVLWLDLAVLLVVPAVLYVSAVAGRSRLAAAGTVLAFLTSLGAIVLVATDALYYEAALQADQAGSIALVSAYQANGLVSGLLAAYLLGHAVGFILLGIALARTRAVPVWAGVALCASPVAEIAGYASGTSALAAAGYALLVVAFGACAVSLARKGLPTAGSPAPAEGPVASAPLTAS